jgi:hypothetical protein
MVTNCDMVLWLDWVSMLPVVVIASETKVSWSPSLTFIHLNRAYYMFSGILQGCCPLDQCGV